MNRLLAQSLQTIKGWSFAWELLALATIARALLSFRTEARLQLFTRAYGLAKSRLVQRLARKFIAMYLHQGSEAWEHYRVGWERYEYAQDQQSLSRSIVVKSPGEGGEKGVMLVHFEYNWLRLLSGVNQFDEFDRQWTVVFTTSWSPTDYSLLALAVSKISGPIYIQPCNYEEIPKLRAFHPRIRVLDSLPCDWLHPSFYEPKPWKNREIDILMISNWAPFKRHWEFFQALTKLPSDLKIVCVGQPQDGCTLSDIRSLAEKYAVPQQIQFEESIPIADVTAMQCNAKISVIFSLREGCCIAAAESLLAGAVLAMRRSAHVGPKAYINDTTGALLDPGMVADQLSAILDTGEKFDSASWAKENIASTKTTADLNQLLHSEADLAGELWNTDIIEPVWRPYPTFLQEDDRDAMAAAYQQLNEDCPTVFGADLAASSYR